MELVEEYVEHWRVPRRELPPFPWPRVYLAVRADCLGGEEVEGLVGQPLHVGPPATSL